ncbi:MAG: glycosyltransferase [Endomicrobia bacterium]|nr:glycosyltransferase [Endomicrobiia bacterium]
MPKISVVIPTYNRVSFVIEAIESVFNQTYKDFEVIVVNDCSQDNTEKILTNRYGNKIKIISHSSNLGLSAARNSGINYSNGEYIAFLDDDDIWLPNKLEEQISFMETHRFLWSATNGKIFSIEKQKVLYYHNDIQKAYDGYVLYRLFFDNFIGPSSVIINKRIFEKVGGFYDEKIVAEDWDMWLRISIHYPLGYIYQPLVIYRYHPNRKTNIRNISEQIKRVYNTVERINSIVPGKLNRFKTRCLVRIKYLYSKILFKRKRYKESFELLKFCLKFPTYMLLIITNSYISKLIRFSLFLRRRYN